MSDADYLTQLARLGRHLSKLRAEAEASEASAKECRAKIADLEKTRDSLMRALGLIA